MFDFLLLASWGLSLAFAFCGGCIVGFTKAHKDRMEFINGAKQAVFQCVEKVRGHE